MEEDAGKGGGVSPRDEETRVRRDGVFPATLPSREDSPLRSTLPAQGGELVDDEPKSIGRFVVLRRIGAGGMGVVYSGYDELLDRRLAIKLVRGEHYDATAQTRMLREAQALGRLSHPNVVQVYEVGEFAGQIYLAMEFVRGETLRAWVAARREGPAEVDDRAILELFLAAGEGLVAAHAAGLVHRDFKPDNVLAGDDGRVRVLDFGLAAAAGGSSEAGEETLRESSDAFDAPLTHRGAILGTPAYMAPEQLAGAGSDARADVFSFAVALYEALFGVRPFVGDTVQELLRSIHTRRRRTPAQPRRRGMQWVVPVLERGLASDPDERWQTMEAFLAALREDPALRVRRLRWLLALVSALVIAAAFVIADHRLEVKRCEEAGAVIDGLWSPEEQGRIREGVLASGSPHAASTWERLRGRVDIWAGEWREARLEACHEREDDVLAEARAACLERQLWRLEGLLDGLAAATPGIVDQGVAGVSRLEPVVRCEDLRRLGELSQEGEEGGGPSPQVMALERRLARLRALLSLGEFADVAEESESLEAPLAALGNPRLAAEGRFLSGSALRKTGDFESAASAVADAYFRAGAVGDDRLAAEAAIIEVAILGIDLNREEAADSWSANATMMLDRAGLEDADLGAMWQLIRGVLHRRKGEYSEALASYDAAKTIIDRELGPRHPETAKIYANMASVHANRGEFEEAVRSLRHGLEIFVESQGRGHPDVAVFYGNLGAILSETGHYEEGLAEHRRSYAANRANFGDDHPLVGYDLCNIGGTLNELGKYGEATDKLIEAQRIIEEKLGPEHPMLGFVLTELGRNLGALGQVERGIELLERAAEIRAQSGDPGNLAVTQFYEARLLGEIPGQRARARALIKLAIDVFAGEEHHDAKRLPMARAWLREHPAEASEPGVVGPLETLEVPGSGAGSDPEREP